MMKDFLRWIGLGLVLLGTTEAYATLLEVTHSPVAGQYGSVNAALAAATTNDVIEIIDNSLPFIGSVAVDGSSLAKNNLVIRGKAGLNPRPTLQGTGVASPFDGGVRAVFTYNNAVDNLQVQDLIFQGTASDDVICDARFWNGASFINCDFLSVGGWNAVRSQVATTFTNCKMTGANNTVEHFFGGPLILDGCTVSGGPDNGMNISGGQVVLRNKSLISCNNNTSLLIHGEFAGNNPNVQITKSIVTHGSSGGGNLLVINSGGAGAGVTTLTIDNSDLIGDVSNYPANSITGAGIILNTTVAALSVTDTIFFNINSVAYALNGNIAGLTNCENYNVYEKAPNNLQDQGLTQGANNLYLANADALYVDPMARDFRLISNSLATIVNSTGTPVYAGSQGPAPGPGVVRVLEVTHTPTAQQYGTIAAAVSAAHDGDIVEVIDNSAAFTEAVVIEGTSTSTKNNLTLRGKVGLNPRPTVKGSVVSPFDAGIGKVVMTYKDYVDNLHVENLIFAASTGDNVVVDARFWNGATFKNCKMDGTLAGLNVFRSQVATNLIKCELNGSPNTIDHFFGGPLNLETCTLNGGPTANAINIGGGVINVTSHSLISSPGSTTILIRDQFAGNPTTVTLSNSIVAQSGTNGGQNLIVINADAGGDKSALIADNCDFIGNLTGYPSSPSNTGAGIVLNTRVNKLQVTDSIFFNISSVAYAINGFTTGLTGSQFENFNVHQKAPNNLVDQGLTPGASDLLLDDSAPLYVNVLGGDFRVVYNSSAAALNSTGTPPYPGSMGTSPAPNAARHWQLFSE